MEISSAGREDGSEVIWATGLPKSKIQNLEPQPAERLKFQISNSKSQTNSNPKSKIPNLELSVVSVSPFLSTSEAS